VRPTPAANGVAR